LRDPDGFRAEEPQSLRYWKTLEEVPSAAEGRWVAFVRHAQAGHNVSGLFFKLYCMASKIFSEDQAIEI